MNKNTGDGELLKYFWPFPYPKHKPPIEVIFSNGVPQSDDPDHMVFQIPYNTFEQAIKKYAAQEANKAQRQLLEGLMEQIGKSAIITLDTDPQGVDKVKNIAVGKFVRLNDVGAVIRKFINDSLAVS